MRVYEWGLTQAIPILEPRRSLRAAEGSDLTATTSPRCSKVLLTLRVRNISRSEMSTILVHNQIEKEHRPSGTAAPLSPLGECRGEGPPAPPGWSYYTNVQLRNWHLSKTFSEILDSPSLRRTPAKESTASRCGLNCGCTFGRR